MKKEQLLNNLLDYENITKKTTRKAFINTIYNRANALISDYDTIADIDNFVKDGKHYNLGAVVEVLVKKILGEKLTFNNKKIVIELDKEKTPAKLNKNGKPCRYDRDHAVYKQVYKNCTSYEKTPDQVFDILHNNDKIEVKFSTSDALATPLNNSHIVDKVIVVSLTKQFQGVFLMPPSAVLYNSQNKVEWNQPAKYLNKELTQALFGLGL